MASTSMVRAFRQFALICTGICTVFGFFFIDNFCFAGNAPGIPCQMNLDFTAFDRCVFREIETISLCSDVGVPRAPILSIFAVIVRLHQGISVVMVF